MTPEMIQGLFAEKIPGLSDGEISEYIVGFLSHLDSSRRERVVQLVLKELEDNHGDPPDLGPPS